MESVTSSGGASGHSEPLPRSMAFDPVTEALRGTSDVLQIKRMDHRDVQRKVFIRNAVLVEKVYRMTPGLRDRKHSWKFEDRALKQLEGLNVPRSYGYRFGRDLEDQAVCVLTKDYVAGKKPQSVDDPLLRKLASVLAKFHQRGVVTNDCSLDNMLLSDQDELWIFDFSKARTFKKGNPLLYYYMGRELFKVRRRVLDHRDDLYADFCSYYFSEIHALVRIRVGLIRQSARYLIWIEQRMREWE